MEKDIERGKKQDLKRLHDLEPTLSPPDFAKEVERIVRSWMVKGWIEPSQDFLDGKLAHPTK